MENPYAGAGLRLPSQKCRRLSAELSKPVRFVSTSTAMPSRNYNRTVVPSSQIAASAFSSQIDAAEFANYSSFALKMMSKMGFKTGSGLGKHEQGMISFTEPRPRPRNLGMGFHGPENPPTLVAQPKNRKRKADSGIEIACKVLDRMPPPLIVNLGDDVPQVNPAEDSTKDAIAGDDVLPVDLEKVTYEEDVLLVDLGEGTGWWDDLIDDEIVEDTPEDDIDEIDVLRVDLDENVVQNCALVAYLDEDTAEDDISQIASDLRREREKLVCLGSGIGVKEIIDRDLERMQSDLLSGALTIDSLFRTFKYLKDKFEEEYKLCNLSIMAFSYTYLLLVEVFEGWEPLQNPMHGLKLMSSWRDLLQDVETCDNAIGSWLFELLVSEVVLPAVMISVTNTWQVWKPKPILRFLELWNGLLPASVRQSILDNVVMPKLSAAVESWNAMRETVHIHAWIHPWLPLLGQRLEGLYDRSISKWLMFFATEDGWPRSLPLCYLSCT